MVGKLAKTLGFLGAFGAGIAGYNEADAQNPSNVRVDYFNVPKKQYKDFTEKEKALLEPAYYISKKQRSHK